MSEPEPEKKPYQMGIIGYEEIGMDKQTAIEMITAEIQQKLEPLIGARTVPVTPEAKARFIAEITELTKPIFAAWTPKLRVVGVDQDELLKDRVVLSLAWDEPERLQPAEK